MKIDGMKSEQILARRALLLAVSEDGSRRERWEFMHREGIARSSSMDENRKRLVRYALEMLGWTADIATLEATLRTAEAKLGRLEKRTYQIGIETVRAEVEQARAALAQARGES